MLLWLLAVLVLIILIVYLAVPKHVLTPSNNNKAYLVQAGDEHASANMLSKVDERVTILLDYLRANPSHDFKQYEDQLLNANITLIEASPMGKHTSYTVNKSKIAICLRTRTGILHDINTIMYVVIHELAHVACPEVGHTPLFKKIFIHLLQVSIHLGIYEQVHYDQTPQPYCGIVIRENLLN